MSVKAIQQIGDLIELEVDRMTFGPNAVGRFGEMVVFVAGAAPGERVQAKITRFNKNYWEARTTQVLTKSDKRVTPPCPVFEKCGGCQWQHLTYEAQIEAKTETLLHQIGRATKISADDLRSKLNVHAAPNPLGYRTRIQAHGDKNGLGFFQEGTHDLVYTDSCVIAHPKVQQAWTTFQNDRPLAEIAKGRGQFKVEWTLSESGQVREAINEKHAAYGFTQVNPEQNQVMTKLVTEMAKTSKSRKVLFDLFGGDGNLSNALTNEFAQIVSVDSFNDGDKPGKLDGELPKGRAFIRESVEEFLKNRTWLDWNLRSVDCIIADPPRNGIGQTSVAHMKKIAAQQIVLVSCDPSTLARDLAGLLDEYGIEAIHLIDMFPQTYHQETVVHLTRKHCENP